MNTRQQAIELLKSHEETLTERWSAAVVATLRGRIGGKETQRELRELFGALLTGLAADADTGAVPGVGTDGFGELRALLTELSRNRARQGFTPSETAVSVFALKDAIFELAERSASLETWAVAGWLARVLDGFGLFTFETYSRMREEIIADQSEQLLELSTPVVKLWDGVVAVPLVGTLDSARTQVVMEKLLQALVDTGSEQAIIDITGVPAVDTQVAQHLLKTVVAARLMGAECTISGISPQIAQTIVALGIEFGDITTKSSLADALAHALRRGGLEIPRGMGHRQGQ
ncbi:STAS domain-containing protein [Streptomyces sp. SID3343]|uniref:STAS domain-containing protein n=1 Tax=Streptomyces sp. SID3343 TaxID=2690260 RepID=UPI00136D90C1|nr:STAS domain-containing protein [Streptomyces sp. SID3343]MYW03124.1 STAS domain-containing protein [Streptomyces sp. SID3343]